MKLFYRLSYSVDEWQNRQRQNKETNLVPPYRLNLTSQSTGRESHVSASNISSTGSVHSRITPSRRATPLRAARKRTLLEESEERSLQDFSVTSSAKGDLEVAEACPDGSFVKIRNKGKKVQLRDSGLI